MATPLPIKVMWAGRVFGAVTAVAFGLYIDQLLPAGSFFASIVIGVSVAYTFINIFPWLFVRTGFELHKWRRNRNQYKPYNLERV